MWLDVSLAIIAVAVVLAIVFVTFMATHDWDRDDD
jgi:uncharacterized protein YoxC